jgi:16S rRNA (guanine527-N7)-methyltransferase
MNPAQELAAGTAQMGLVVTPEQQAKLLDYLALLHKWNTVYNLTAIRQPEQMVSNHLLDSLAVLPYLWPKRWLDVGCGAGLPGLVLAVMRPEWSFTLLDSNSKKTGFVQQAIIELGLHNVEVRCERVERWQTEQKFDGIISRAFAGRFCHADATFAGRRRSLGSYERGAGARTGAASRRSGGGKGNYVAGS